MDLVYNGFVVTSIKPRMGRCQYDTAEHPELYRGIAYGVPWPLNVMSHGDLGESGNQLVDMFHEYLFYRNPEPRSVWLPGEPQDDGTAYTPDAVSDVEKVMDYVRLCEKAGIETRIFLVATVSDWPRMDYELVHSLLPQSKCLGYDYISAGFNTSSVYDEILPKDHPVFHPLWLTQKQIDWALEQLSAFTPMLNQYGLMDNEDDLVRFVATRWEVAKQTRGREGISPSEIWLEEDDYWPCLTYEMDW